MKELIESIKSKVREYKIENQAELEAFRIEFIGSKGSIKDLFSKLKEVAKEDKREVGQLVNTLRNLAEEKYNELKEKYENAESDSQTVDFSRPGEEFSVGSHHPISLVRDQIIEIFNRIGFNVSEGPEIEDDWHNFSAL